MDILGGLIAFLGLVGLTFAGWIAALLGRKLGPIVFLGYLGYGILVGKLTILWLRGGGENYLWNMPGQYLGITIHTRALKSSGALSAADSDALIPWILREPQVYVLASALAWGVIGLLVWGWLSLCLPSVSGGAPTRATRTSTRAK